MPKRRYKSKWHRYGTIIGVLFVGIGGLLMILLGVQSLFGPSSRMNHFLSNFITIQDEFMFLWDITTIIIGIVILAVTAQQKPYEKDTLTWMILSALLAIIGGTVAGLVVFGGTLIYLIFYIL